MNGKTQVLIRHWATEGQIPTDGEYPKLTQITLAAIPAFMLGRDIRRYQYAAGSDWCNFTQADTGLMRGEVEARMQQAVAAFSRLQQSRKEDEVAP